MTIDRVLQEFLSEAQEIVESYNRDLLALDAGRQSGAYDPERINNAFRAVHSLKGLAGLFAVGPMTRLSHALESLLDQLRLGRVRLVPEVLDLLFEAVELYGAMIADTSAAKPLDEKRVDDYLGRIAATAGAAKPAGPPARLAGFDLDPAILSVLTEYEEHRLRESIAAGRTLYRIHAPFDLASIDKGLDELKARLKPVGEVVTYLPSTEPTAEDKIDLDVILASDRLLGDVEGALTDTGASVSTVNPGPAVPALARAAAPAAAAPAGEDAEGRSLKSISQTVRVDIRKLDYLMNLVGELTVARTGILAVLDELRGHRDVGDLVRRLQHESRTLERKLNELQAGILEVRMVPLGQIFDKLSRVVRRISREAGKEVRLTISGAETELDKLIVEELSDPLMHIIRNAIDHGVESGEARRRAGKPEAGTIAIVAQQRGNHVVIDVRDDGAGFDEARILETALQRGLVAREQAHELSRRELLNLVFLPGFSTRDTATELSGRGVGMDVVKTNIAKLSGIIDLASTRGRGTQITITLPITLAIIPALIIRSAGRTYAVPLNSVLESLTMTQADVRTIEGREVLTLRGQTLTLARVDHVLELQRGEPAPARSYVVVVGLAQHRLGLVVDELVGQQDIVIKSLGRALSGVPGIAGATELGGQQIVLVLDVGALVEESRRRASEAA